MAMRGFWLSMITGLSFGCIFAGSAEAHSWYPQTCCSGQDCEAIPIDGIVETSDGYRVTYLSPRFGAIDEYIPRNTVRLSEDGSFHGCWRKDKSSPRRICFFAPVNV
jgi:hypothetical protein